MSEEIQTYEYVVCPYCNEKISILQHTHLKKHGKTTQDLKNEYPGYPMKCLRLQELSKQGGQKSKETHSKMKKINCIYCDSEMEVHNNESNKQACKSCLNKGLENPDGRTKSSANQRRTETLKKKYGENVTNIAHIDGAMEKRSSTNLERYGGVGFASQELAEKTKKVIKDMYGDENIMRTEHGKHRRGKK